MSRRRWKPILHPLPGRRLPRGLRASRVDRLASRLEGGVREPKFADLLQRIDSAPIHHGNRVRVFVDGDHAFAAMRQAIAAAGSEVLVEAYILRDDAVGHAFLEDLAEAVERGVAVRVVADAYGSSDTGERFWRQMRERGIDLNLFNPLIKAFWYQAYRDHRKILVVDREIAFTGGMNLGEEYGSVGSHKEGTWRDTHLEVRGPVAWEMAVVFAESWLQAGGTPFEIAALEVSEAPPSGAQTLVLDSRPYRGNAEAAAVLSAIAGAARQRLWITNAYFAPPRVALGILGRAAARGVDVRLLLPGITDVPLVRHAGHGSFAQLLKHGVRIFEYQPAILHAKSLVVDAYASVVGSTNLDFRSFQLNSECNLVLLDEDTGAALESAFENDLGCAHEIVLADWCRRPLRHRLGDRAARWLSPLL